PSRGGNRQFPRDLRRSARQGVLHLGVLRSPVHSWTISLCGTSSTCDRRDARIDCRTLDRGFRGGRRVLLPRAAGAHRPRARTPIDACRRPLGGDRPRSYRLALSMGLAGRHLWLVRLWLLSPPRLYPGPRDGPVADRARRRGVFALLVLLS